MGYSFIFCIFISTAFCDEGAQLLMQKDTPLESLPSNDNSVNPLNDDGLKVDEAKAEDMPSISMKTVEDVMENDSANPVSDDISDDNDDVDDEDDDLNGEYYGVDDEDEDVDD